MRRVLLAVAMLCVASPALPQSTYPTQYGGRVAGVVVLQCDTNGANCQPNGSTGSVAAQVQGNTASGTADAGNPVKVGGIVVNNFPALTVGNRQDLLFNLAGEALVSPMGVWTATDTFANTGIGQNYGTFGQNIVPSSAGFVFNGTSWDRARGDVNGAVTQPALSATFWNYAAVTGGILNTTTAVTVKAAAGAGVRNYVSAMQCNTEAFTTASEFAIRDGAAGTVLWRSKIPTTGWPNGREVTFTPALRGTANTLTEIVTLTASGAGAIYCNLQGYTGS